MSKIEFPQPLVTAPDASYRYWFITLLNTIDCHSWENDNVDRGILAAGNCYATQKEAQHRCEWNKQKMACLIIPAWFKELGPEVEFRLDENAWVKSRGPYDWTSVDPAKYRTKPKPAPDIVKVIDGVEYRWPATVTVYEKPGLRYVVDNDDFGIYELSQSSRAGVCVHLTRQAAETQAAALKAFWF